MLDLALYIPPSPWLISDRVDLPLGILYVAASAERSGYSVKIIDLSGGGEFFVPNARYYGVGWATPQCGEVKKIVEKIRKFNPAAKLIAGGAHPTALPESAAVLGFDYVVRGEGDVRIVEILSGICDARVVFPVQYIPNVDDLPFPAWHMIDMESYIESMDVCSYVSGGKREVNVVASRGCNGRCAYCTRFKGPIRQRDVASVVGEVGALMTRYGANSILFSDDNILVNKDWLKELCRELMAKKHHLQWRCLGRADQLDLDTANMMRSAGCAGIDFGVETASQKLLDVVKKNTTVQLQSDGIRAAHAAGLKVRCQMMVGLPQETDDDVAMSESFINRHIDCVDRWGIHTFVPLPSCDIFRRPEKYRYEFNSMQPFDSYQTIGKPGEWAYKPTNSEDVERRRNRLIEAASTKNIFVYQ